MLVLTPKQYFDSLFLSYYVSNCKKKEIAKKACGISIIHSHRSDIEKLLINYPTLDEQKDIAHFISLISRREGIIKSKIEALKKYKEGLVKSIFSKLETFPTVSLSSLCKITTGKLDANAMSKNGKYMFFTCSRENYLIDAYAFDCEAILVSGNGEVGLTKYYKGKFNAYQRTYVLYNFKTKPLYAKLCIDSQIGSVIRKETNKGAMPYIRLTTFNKIRVPKVSDKYELTVQRFIESIDNKGLVLEEQLKELISFKKQLLNTLFI